MIVLRLNRDLPADTPWDEPSTNSPEFAAYLTGELLQYSPWSNITGHSRSGARVFRAIAGGPDFVGSSPARTAQRRSHRTTYHATGQAASVVHEVRHSVQRRAALTDQCPRPSQVQRHEIPRMLTQGMRDAGMMDMILPPVNSQARWV